MTRPPSAEVLEPAAVAVWLDIGEDWIMRAIARGELPILGRRGDGVPLVSTTEVRAWLRRPRLADDET